MTTQKEKAELFNSLHIKGSPVILFNVWDAGSARTIEQAGAKAIATGSWSVAAAQGFDDGEKIPIDLVFANLERIVSSVTVPVTLDFEGGYATNVAALKENIRNLIAAGGIGLNFEDRIVGGDGLHSVEDQSTRIEAIRETAETAGLPLFINARSDVFLETYPAQHNETELQQALERAEAYAKAGASGFFAPGLRDPDLIRKLCDNSPLPVNILFLPDTPPTKTMAELGVARISYGASPYRLMMAALKEAGEKALRANS
ncbi:MAG TPA: isocitrate lyase/phosphoenolpyruvate mutase family protein [Pyrinomonadaceae bacterium]|nr:isocitrate lyase/phosphoenolpyruvate mutase family protein [Pyrinomonadaceae bacterium]